MTRKRYFCLFILVFVILYTMVDKNPLLTNYFFSLNMQLMMHHTFYGDLFIKAAFCCKNLAVILMNKKQAKYKEKVTFLCQI